MRRIAFICLGIILISFISSCKLASPSENQETNGTLYPVYMNGKYGYIDSNGKIIIKPQFDDAQDFFEGLAVVYKNGLAGFIDQSGEFVIEPQFDYAGSFYNRCV